MPKAARGIQIPFPIFKIKIIFNMTMLEKTAIITGASKGIGKAIAIGLAKLNYRTVLIGRNRDDLEKVAKEIIESNGAKPTFFVLDITDSAAIKNTIKKVHGKLGRIDILVNNAGIYFDGTTDIPESDFRLMVDTNLTAQFVFVKEVAPIMKAQKSGYIFNLASRSGKVGFGESGAYSASKFALVGFNESLYRELAPFGISVTALCPAWVNTKMARKAGSRLEAEQMIQPEDLMLTVEWLLRLSPGACVKEVVLETPYSIV